MTLDATQAKETLAEFYSDPSQVGAYGRAYLEEPEVILLHEVGAHLRELDMLDLGIGAGRTTAFFAPLTKRYVGVDIAEGMLARCRQRFWSLTSHGQVEFALSDATDLKEFADESFDLVLFSFNGLDCVPETDRSQAIQAVRRVLKPGGRWIFSTHNLRFIESYYRLVWYRHPRKLLGEWNRLRRIRRHNGALAPLLTRDQVSFWDGVYEDHPDLKHVHIKPEHQVRELERSGFSDVTVRSRETGRVLQGDEIAREREPWIYFSCVRA